MPGPDELIWTALTACVTSAVGGCVGYWFGRAQERIRIEGTLGPAADLDFIEKIGCSGLMLTVSNKSKRHAKIRDAYLIARGVNLLPAMQQAFDDDFGHEPTDLGPPPSLAVKLIRFSKPNSEHGYILERDDVCTFALPIRIPPLPQFINVLPEDVRISVKFFDETERTVLKGEIIQNQIKTLIEVWGSSVQTLKHAVEISIRASSKKLPNVSAVGTINPNGVSVNERGELVSIQKKSLIPTSQLEFDKNQLQIGQDVNGQLLARLSADLVKQVAQQLKSCGVPITITVNCNVQGAIKKGYIVLVQEHINAQTLAQGVIVPVIQVIPNPPN